MSGCFFDLNRLNALGPGEAGGTTVNSDGDVAAFAKISIDGLPIRTSAQADGRFVARNIPAGQWRLLAKDDANGDGWPERAAIIGFRIVNAESTDGLFGAPVTALSSVDLGNVVMEGTVRVEGEVVDASELPASDARVVIVQNSIPIGGSTDLVDSLGLVESRVATGANGEFIIPAVIPGTFDVIAFAERDDGLHMSVPRSITQLSGAADLTGDGNWIELVPTTARRSVGFRVFPEPTGDADVVVRFRRGAAGIDASAEERTATRDGDQYVVPDILAGPWTVRVVVDGTSFSALESRFVLPGTGIQQFGDFRVLEGGCDQCDCDGDGVPGLPQHPSATVRDAVCDFSSAEAASIWSVCEGRCGLGVSACLVDGRVFDCEDDLDGQQDVQEPLCYGIDKGGVDCDGDGVCEAFDPDDRCATGSCTPSEVIDLCNGSVGVVDPTDGGPSDAGVDAGVEPEVDAGVEPEVDAGFDGGIDAGFDAGIDAGFDAGIDAGFDAGIDAGPTLVLPPSFNGSSVTAPFDEVRLEAITGLNFFQTATVFYVDSDFPDPRLPNCANDRVPFGEDPNEIIVVYDDDGNCAWVTGVVGGDKNNDVTSIVGDANGGAFFSTSFSGETPIGSDGAGTVTATGTDPLALVHYDATGAVVSHRVIEFPADALDLTDATLASHPLAQGPVAVVGVNNIAAAADFTLDGITVPMGEFATFVIFFDETLTATDIVNVGAAGVAPELIAMPSATRIVIGGGADGTIFAGTPAEIDVSGGFFAEVQPGGGAWARGATGFEGEVAFGVDAVAEEFYIATNRVSPDDGLLISTNTETVSYRLAEQTQSVFAGVPSSAAIDVDTPSSTIFYADNTTIPAVIFGFNFLTQETRVVASGSDDETFLDILSIGNGDILFTNSYGIMSRTDDGTINFLISNVDGPIAFDDDNRSVFFASQGVIQQSNVDNFNTPFGNINVSAPLFAHEENALVWYSENGGVGEFRIADTEFNFLEPAPFLTGVNLTNPRDLIYDAESDTVYISSDDGISVIEGVTPTTTGGVTLEPLVNSPASPLGLARLNGTGFIRADGSTDFLSGFGLAHLIHIDRQGDIAGDYPFGRGIGDFGPKALAVNGTAFTLFGKVDGVVEFDRDGGGFDLLRNDEAVGPTSTFSDDESGGVRLELNGGTGELLSQWTRQTENSNSALNIRATPFPDATLAVAATTFSEMRVGDSVFTGFGIGATSIWRIGDDGGGTIAAPTHADVVDVSVGAGDFDLVTSINQSDDVVALLDDGYVMITNAPGDSGFPPFFPTSACAFSPSASFPRGRFVIKRTFDGDCQWIRAYIVENDSIKIDVATGPNNEVVIAVATGSDPVNEFDSSNPGAGEVTLIDRGAFVSRVAADGTTIYSFGIRTLSPQALPVRALINSRGDFGMVASTMDGAVAFPGAIGETTIPTSGTGVKSAVFSIATAFNMPLIADRIDRSADGDVNIEHVIALPDGPILVEVETVASPAGSSFFDDAVVLAPFNRRYVTALFDLGKGGLERRWLNIHNRRVEAIAATPGGREFAIGVSYESDGGLTATFDGSQAETLEDISKASQLFVVDVDSGALVGSLAIQTDGNGIGGLSMVADGQITMAVGIQEGEAPDVISFIPDIGVVRSEPFSSLDQHAYWRFARGGTGAYEVADVQYITYVGSGANFPVLTRPFAEEVAVLTGAGPFQSDVGSLDVTPSSHPILVRLPSTSINKAPSALDP